MFFSFLCVSFQTQAAIFLSEKLFHNSLQVLDDVVIKMCCLAIDGSIVIVTSFFLIFFFVHLVLLSHPPPTNCQIWNGRATPPAPSNLSISNCIHIVFLVFVFKTIVSIKRIDGISFDTRYSVYALIAYFFIARPVIFVLDV